MSRPEGPHGDSVERVVFPPSSSPLFGWIVMALFAVLGVWAAISGGLTGWRLAAGLALLCVLVHAYLVRPVVATTATAIELVNPLGTVSIDFTRVTRVLVRSVTYVYVGETRYSGVGVGRSVRSMARPQQPTGPLGPIGFSTPHASGRDHNADLLEEQLNGLVRASPPGEGEVRRTWSWPHLVGIAVLAVVLVALLLA